MPRGGEPTNSANQALDRLYRRPRVRFRHAGGPGGATHN